MKRYFLHLTMDLSFSDGFLCRKPQKRIRMHLQSFCVSMATTRTGSATSRLLSHFIRTTAIFYVSLMTGHTAKAVGILSALATTTALTVSPGSIILSGALAVTAGFSCTVSPWAEQRCFPAVMPAACRLRSKGLFRTVLTAAAGNRSPMSYKPVYTFRPFCCSRSLIKSVRLWAATI